MKRFTKFPVKPAWKDHFVLKPKTPLRVSSYIFWEFFQTYDMRGTFFSRNFFKKAPSKVNPLSASTTKWLNTQAIVGNLSKHCFECVLDDFLGLALKGLTQKFKRLHVPKRNTRPELS